MKQAPPYLFLAVSVFLWCGFIWLFQDTLTQTMLDREQIRQGVIAETRITIGIKAPCMTTVALSVWEPMNTLGIYRWVSKCEDEQK